MVTNDIIYKLCLETKRSISECYKTLEQFNDYEKAKYFLTHIELRTANKRDWFSNDKDYIEHLEYIDKCNSDAIVKNNRFDNEGIPVNAIELEFNKKYSGDADGDFEIKTINNRLYIIPLTSCFCFGEDFDE